MATLERVCLSGERALAGGDQDTAAIAVECGKRLGAHPEAMELIDSLPWRRAQRRLRDLARKVPGPLTSDALEGVPLALAVAWRGRVFEPIDCVLVPLGTVVTPEMNAMLLRRRHQPLYAVPGGSP